MIDHPTLVQNCLQTGCLLNPGRALSVSILAAERVPLTISPGKKMEPGKASCKDPKRPRKQRHKVLLFNDLCDGCEAAWWL